MDWVDVCDTADFWAASFRKVASDLQNDCSLVYTREAVGYYGHRARGCLAYYAPLADAETAKQASDCLQHVADRHGLDTLANTIMIDDLADPAGAWVKLAMSPTLHRTGELLNFYPGQFPGGIPNTPSPLAAMLTSGLLGAGLGWGAGRLAKRLLPKGYGDNLGRLGAMLGGTLGASPGLAWGLTNKAVGRHFNDPALTQSEVEYPNAMHGANAGDFSQPTPLRSLLPAVDERLHETILPKHFPKLSADLVDPRFREMLDKVAETFGAAPDRLPTTPSDVNINHLGQVLWDTGASPSLAAATMGAMYAAQQMPDSRGRPGLATGHQLGQLAANAAGDYIRGRLVGSAINAVIGTPYSSSAFGVGSVALGVLGAVVPKLFSP